MKHLKATRDFLRGDPHRREEFKSQLKLLIIVTLGFTIAFSWRQTIFDAFLILAVAITHVESSTAASIYASILITIISLLSIYLTSIILKDDPRYK